MSRPRSGENAVERGIDPRGPCSICGEPFAGFDLQDDHVMPIGARRADEGLVLVKAGGGFAACLQSEAPAGADVFMPVPCAALAHAHCNQSKGATRNVARWRHPSLPPLVVAVNEAGDRIALAPLAVLEPSPETDWDDAQKEAYDRGVEALRRRGRKSARNLRTIDEMAAENLRLEREHRRAAAEARADEMIEKAAAKLASMGDWREVRKATGRIEERLGEAEDRWASLPPPPDGAHDAYFDGCFDRDEAAADLRRWHTALDMAKDRSVELYEDAVGRYKRSASGQAEAKRLAALTAEQRIRAFNRYEKQAAETRRPADRAKAELAEEALAGLGADVRHSLYHNGRYAKLRPWPAPQHPHVTAGRNGRAVDPATGEIMC